MRRRPKPTRSGSPGWAPIAVSVATAVRTESRIVTGSLAWYPQATFTEVTWPMSSVS